MKASVESVLTSLRADLQPLALGSQRVAVAQAVGGVTASWVTARQPHPLQPVSAMDGFALAGEAERYQLIAGVSAAGRPFYDELQANQALRILTGAVVPTGATAVVEQEKAQIRANELTCDVALSAGRNIRQAGEDIQVGQHLLAQGTQIRPQHLPALLASGVTEVEVFAPLRIGLLATGDELVSPGQTAKPGQVINTNQSMIAAVLQAQGHEVLSPAPVPDSPGLIREGLLDLSERCDVIVTLGGASVGDEDHVRDCLDQVNHWRLALKPGSPMAVGQIRQTWVFALPGNPAAAWVCALLILAPCLSLLGHRGWFEPLGLQMPAAFHRSSPAGRREYWRARLRDGKVEIFPMDGAARLAGLSFSEGLSMLAEDQTEVEPGQPVTYFPYSSWGL